METRKPGLHVVGHDEYHAGPGISSTKLKKYLRSPAHARLPDGDSAAFAFGRALHLALLEPDLYVQEVKVAPEVDRRTKEGKAIHVEFVKGLAPSNIILDAGEARTLRAMASAIDLKNTWHHISAEAVVEQAAYAELRVGFETVLCKSKADLWRRHENTIADLKSCQDASPRAFRRDIYRYGYHISAAFYLDVFSAATGHRHDDFVWIAVEKQPPFGVAFYAATQEMIDEGRRLYREALAIYADCLTSGVYPDYPDEILDLTTTKGDW